MDPLDTPLKPLEDFIALIEADDYIKFKYGAQLKAVKKALEKAADSTSFPIAGAIAKAESLVAFMKEAAGQQPTKSARGSRAPKPVEAAAGAAVAPGHPGRGGKAGQA